MRVNTTPFITNTTTSVAAPSINLSWKLDPESEQTFTFGLARTFSTLGPEMLNPRPEIRDSSLCSTNDLCGVNNPRIPDRAGNPLLSYEKSWGLDLALENQWKDASRWSLRAYHRRIDHTLAWTTELETVPWANTARWVMRPRNLGQAKAVGLTASIDTNLSDWMEDAPDLDINTSVQWNHSNISTVPGPDNRIEKQQPWSWRLGLTYKSESRPLELQADLLLNPGQWWQASPDRRIYTSIQREASIKAIWTFSPKHKLILSLRNLKPVTNRSFTQLAGNPSIQLWTAQRARTGLFLRWESKFE